MVNGWLITGLRIPAPVARNLKSEPLLFSLRLLNVATPDEAATVSVPLRVAPVGFSDSDIVIFPLNPVATCPPVVTTVITGAGEMAVFKLAIS